MRSLREKEIIIKEEEKYLVENPLFELWIRRIAGDH